MYYPQVAEDGNTRSLIDTWLGYNHNYKINNGEFYDMENLTSDNFPLLSPRAIRPLLAEGENIRGLLYSDNNICYLEGDILHYSLQEFDLTPYMDYIGGVEQQTLLRFGAYILIFPLGIYVNVYDPNDIGRMRTRFEAEQGKQITYSICDISGNDYENVVVADTAPENPEEGQYWLNTGENSGLNIWNKSESMWQPVATTYIRIRVEGAAMTDYFAEKDTVNMNTSIANINNGSQIQTMGDDYIVVIGLIPDAVTKTEVTSEAWTLRMERKIPTLDYVCADKNRVWGCHYGYSEDGEMINEIYCSKLGDFKNWYTYQGISTDSYAVSVGVTGEWTGCISFQGYPTFFKENAIFRIYGSYPAEYQIIQNDCRGVQQGSHRSLAVVNEYLFYKSASDVVVYDGSTPVSISKVFGRDERYYDAVGGGCLNKYHLVMQTAIGKRYYFVYDVQHGIWEKESAIPILQFSATENGQLYAITADKLYGLGSTDNIAYANELIGEEWVDWYAQTGEMGYETPDSKYVSKLSIRAHIPYRSEVQVLIAYDDRPFEDVGLLRGAESVASQKLDIMPMRCDHFRILFKGHGDCRIYSMAITLENGSDDYGY